MKRTILTIAVVSVALGIQGCQTTSKVSGIPSGGQNIIYKDGVNTLVSTKKNIVAAGPSSAVIDSNAHGNFVILVKNGTAKNIVLSPNNVTAYAINNGQSTALKVYSYEELVGKEKSRQNMAKFGAALASFGEGYNAGQAGYSYTTGSTNFTARDNYGYRATGYGTFNATTYSHADAQAAQYAAQANARARYAQVEAQGRSNMTSLSSTMLKAETIFPGQWHGGSVKIDLPEVTTQPQDIMLKINAGGENHDFRFSLSKTG